MITIRSGVVQVLTSPFAPLNNEYALYLVEGNLNFLKMCIYSHTYCVCKDTHNVCIYSVYMVHMKARGQHT